MTAATKKGDLPAQTEAELVASARAHRTSGNDIAPGSYVGALPGHKYSSIVTRDYQPGQLAAIRKALANRGYGLATNGEFMIGEPDAEIWAAPAAIRDDEWKDEFIANLLSPAWVNLQSRRSNHGIARKVLAEALKYHDSKITPEARQAAKVAIESIVRNNPISDLQARY